ncbi:MAG: rod shape-determining protein MreD [Luminiphilus sp.]|jgi:rod shape-determining protein MreD|nr:rod shape-determining protein MreD [Luminiphilus sp.]
MAHSEASWAIYFSLACGLIVMLVPLPVESRLLRPDFVALILFYWVLALPHRVGVTTAFFLGVGQDLIEGSPLGLSSIGLMVATVVLLSNYQRIRQFDAAQQSLMILVLMILSSGIEQWLRDGINVPAASWTGLIGLVVSALCWLPIRQVLRYFRRYYEVT